MQNTLFKVNSIFLLWFFFYLAFLIGWWQLLVTFLIGCQCFWLVGIQGCHVIQSRNARLCRCIQHTEHHKIYSITRQFFKYHAVVFTFCWERFMWKALKFFPFVAKMFQLLLVENPTVSAFFYKEKNFEPLIMSKKKKKGEETTWLVFKYAIWRCQADFFFVKLTQLFLL